MCLFCMQSLLIIHLLINEFDRDTVPHYTHLFFQLGPPELLCLIINISKVYLIECIMMAAAVCSASFFPSFIIINNVD